jgi:hypothetical protein
MVSQPTAPVTPTLGVDTTIISGTGTNHSKAEGPIDPDFKSKRQVVGSFRGIRIWGSVRYLLLLVTIYLTNMVNVTIR